MNVWIRFSKYIGRCLCQAPQRLVVAVGVVLAATAGFCVVLGRMPTAAHLQGGLIQSWLLAPCAAALLMILAVVAVWTSTASASVMLGDAGRRRAVVGWAAGSFKMVCVGALFATLLLGAANPINGNRLVVVFGDFDVNVGAECSEMLKIAEKHVRAAREQGISVTFSPPAAGEIVDYVITNGLTDEAALRLRDALDHTGERLHGRLRVVGDELQGRFGDGVIVISTKSRPDTSFADVWPINESATHSQWLSTSGQIDESDSDKPRVQYYSITQDAAVRSQLEVQLEVPATLPYPVLEYELLQDGVKVFEKSITPPARGDSWAAASDKRISFGRWADRLSYQLEIPRLGNQIKLRLVDPNGSTVWNEESVRVPRFSGTPFALRLRVVDIQVDDSQVQRVMESLKLGGDAAEKVWLDSVRINASAMCDPVPVKLGDVPPDTFSGRMLNILFSREAVQPGVGEARFARTEHFFLSPLTVWADPDTMQHWADLGKGTVVPPSGVPLVRAASDAGELGVIVYQADRARPGWVTLILPSPENIDKLDETQRRGLAFLVRYAASLAQRAGSYETPMIAEFLDVEDAIVALPVSAGPERPEASMLVQLWGAVSGKLDGRVAPEASNRVGAPIYVPAIALSGLLALTVIPRSVVSTVQAWRRKPLALARIGG